jgi:hypothetical protein
MEGGTLEDQDGDGTVILNDFREIYRVEVSRIELG